jgi:hypothetical protein
MGSLSAVNKTYGLLDFMTIINAIRNRVFPQELLIALFQGATFKRDSHRSGRFITNSFRQNRLMPYFL